MPLRKLHQKNLRRGKKADVTLAIPDPHVVVIFGASGDLTGRKLIPALYNLFARDLLPDHFAVIGYSRTKLSDEEFQSASKKSVAEHSRTGLNEKIWEWFEPRLHYVSGQFESEGAMAHLVDALERCDDHFGTEGRRVFYCATPAEAFPQIVQRIGEEHLQQDSRIVIEKPFGEDLKSAQELNRALHEVFSEEQIYRIDHYLGKETVQNILAFRFSNGLFEPVWNRSYVKSVEINVAETLGVEGRGKFYETAGAIRDIVQNHLLQLLTILAMEPPASFDAELIRNEKVKVLNAMPAFEPRDVVRGQYIKGSVDGEDVPGYREEEGVDPKSKTETFAAIKGTIENWRWAGVPFYMRTGKRLAHRTTQITITFHDAPHLLFEESGSGAPEPNNITIRIQPNEGISLTFDAKVPGPEMQVTPVKMDFDYEESFMTEPAEAYERLLHDVMDGDRTLFTRADEVERAWQILDPVLDRTDPQEYAAGSWGPKQADDLIAPGRWYLR